MLAVLLAGCGAASGGGAPGGPGLPLQPDAGTTGPQGPSAEVTVRPPEPTLDPSTLRGLWAAGDEDGAQILYEFDADGTFTRISLLSQERPGGTFRFQDVVEGTFRLDGDALALRPTAGAQTVDDPDSPDGDGPVSTARTDLERETHRARLREGGDVLVLEPRDGAAVSLVRQEG